MMDPICRAYGSALFTEAELTAIKEAAQFLLDVEAQAVIRDLLVQGALPSEQPRVVARYDAEGLIWVKVL